MNEDKTGIQQTDRATAPMVRAAVAAILLASASAVHAADLAAASTDGGAAVTEEVVVTGTRSIGLTASESPAPIQLVSGQALANAGAPDLISALATVVPSFTGQSFGGDMSNQTLQAKLRGLSPNHVLVLINGKRRHGTANLAVLGGAFQGGAGVDLNFVPADAIDHVEVLTDGAAAQYGSDAIAGVINIILKKGTSGLNASASTGGYLDGGGRTGEYTGNAGFELGSTGYLNLTGEVINHGHSYRGDIDPRVIQDTGTYPNSNLLLVPGYPYLNRIQGDAEYHQRIASFNAGAQFGSTEFYTFGSYGQKKAESFENLRMPNRVQYTPTGDVVGGPTTRYLYPFGMLPKEASDETDYSLTVGLKGEAAGWRWDVASSIGKDEMDVFTLDSANRSLFRDTGSSPTDFYDGTFKSTQWTTNFDVAHDLSLGGAEPATLALGVEYRRDGYAIGAGDAGSRYKEGPQSFPGFALTDAGNHDRKNYAGYVELDVKPVTGLFVSGAARYEHFSDFGSATIGKITSRYDFSDAFALRGTVSTGFRAPTLAEEFYSATNVSPSSAFVQLPPNAPGGALLGLGNGLQPEKSTNFSAGLVWHPGGGSLLTLDLFQIEIRNRIVSSGTLYYLSNGSIVPGSDAILAAILANGNVLDNGVSDVGINLFVNGIDTRTQGADLVFSVPSAVGPFDVNWSVGATYNKTEVTKQIASPAQLGGQSLYDKAAISDLETASPKYSARFGSQWKLGALSIGLTEAVYGPSSEYQFGDDSNWYSNSIGVKYTTNLDVNYKVNDHLKLSLGAINLFNEYPDHVNYALQKTYFDADDNAAVTRYPGFSPIGINGGYFFAKIGLSY